VLASVSEPDAIVTLTGKASGVPSLLVSLPSPRFSTTLFSVALKVPSALWLNVNWPDSVWLRMLTSIVPDTCLALSLPDSVTVSGLVSVSGPSGMFESVTGAPVSL
jgi:hypothetical protein